MFLQFIREITGGVFNSFFIFCSLFGETPNAIVIIAIIYWSLNKKLGEFLLVSQAGDDLVNGLAKVTACIYRPWVLDSRVKPLEAAIPAATGYSFPSGHVTTATTLFAGSVIKGNLSKALKIVLIICLLLVAFSRNYVGVHSVLDVICALAFSLTVIFIFSKIFDKLEERPDLDIVVSAVGILLAILIVAFAFTKSYPMDYDSAGHLIVDPAILMLDTFRNAGLAIATFSCWIIERRFIKFETEGSLETKALRVICGFIGLEFIYTVIMPLCGDAPLEAFLQFFVIIIFVMLIYPAIIKFCQNRNYFS